ncbi:MAG TPA: hypothetical protein VGD62_08505 [Acidobacteriaceae bacterium]
MQSSLPYILLATFVCGLAATAYRSQRRAIKLNNRTWDQLLSELQFLDFRGVSLVASDYLNPRKGQIDLEPQEIWALLGGDEGLRTMRANADRLIALAAFAQQWNLNEGVIVAERMRRDGIRLRRAVRRIRMGMFSQLITGRHWIEVPFQLQEAASAYYLMRQRLLALYETSHIGLHPRLAQAL